MPLTSKTRALISLAVLLCVGGIAVAWYLHGGKQPLPPAPARPGASPSIFSELPPAAPVIGYVNVADLRALQNTPLGSVLGLAAPGPAEDREYKNFVRDTGFDYTRDLDKIAVAFWPANLTQPAAGLGQNRVLAVADGRFDERKIEAYALRGGKLVKDGGQSVYDVPGNPPVAFEFLSPTRMLIASGQSPASLLEMASKSATDAAMQARIIRVADAPIFAVARTDKLPKGFYSNFKNSPQLEQLARSIQELTLSAQPDGRNIHTVVDAQCDSMKHALYISTLLDTFRMFGRAELADPSVRKQMTKQQHAFLTGLLNHATVNRDTNWVRVTFDLTPAMLGTSQPAR